MPNIRKKGKKFVGAWVSETLYRDLQRAARKNNTDATKIIDHLLTAHVARAGQLRETASSNPVAAAAQSIVAAAVASARAESSAPPPPAKPVTYSIPRRSKKRKPA